MDPVAASAQDEVVAAIASAVAISVPSCGDVTVVAVDGPSGAGKSTLAAALSTRLDAPVVHLDDIYRGWDGLDEAVMLVTSQVLEPLSRGEHAAYRRWDWQERRLADVVSVSWAPLLILEGVGSSARPAGDYAAVRVWVDADRDIRFERAMARDGESYRPLWEHWARQEVELFAADGTAARADVLVDTTAS